MTLADYAVIIQEVHCPVYEYIFGRKRAGCSGKDAPRMDQKNGVIPFPSPFLYLGYIFVIRPSPRSPARVIDGKRQDIENEIINVANSKV